MIGATLSAVLAGWRRRNDRPWLASLAVSALSGVIAIGLASADRQPQTLRRWPAPNAGRPGPSLTDLVSSERPPPIGRE